MPTAFGAVYPIRLLGAVHHLVLSGGTRPALAAHFSTTGGDGDADAAWPLYRDVLARGAGERARHARAAAQTNEVGRRPPSPAGSRHVAP